MEVLQKVFILVIILPCFSAAVEKAAILHFDGLDVPAEKIKKIEMAFRQEMTKKDIFILMIEKGMDWKFRKFQIKDTISGGLLKTIRLGRILEVHTLFSGSVHQKDRQLIVNIQAIHITQKYILFNDTFPIGPDNQIPAEMAACVNRFASRWEKPQSAQIPFKENKPVQKKHNAPSKKTRDDMDIRDRLVAIAKKYYGVSRRHHLMFKGKRFPFDCSGYVRGVYYAAGIDLFQENRKNKNGCEIIYLTLQKKTRVFHEGLPLKGDVIFFDNTYDANRDGQVNDKLSHVGIVTAVDANGTVSFLHRSSRGIRKGYLNRSRPTDRKTNSYLRQPPYPKGLKKFAGELFSAYGSVN